MTSDALPSLRFEKAYRYAVYFAPTVACEWWQAGCRWLGRDASFDKQCAQPPIPGLHASEQLLLTSAPRRYGWHATLKAPFALTADCDFDELRIAIRRQCQTFTPFTMPRLRVAMLDDLLALVPDEPSEDIDFVARACVAELHPFAAPLSAAELARRRAAKLTPEEDEMLLRWGYPYVFDRFRFHMSLTGSLAGVSVATIDLLQETAQQWFESLPLCRFESVALFAEPTPGADFLLLEHVPLGAS
jgi:putative phosphonate metabolism protein